MDMSVSGLLSLIVWVALGCLAFWLAVWAVGQSNMPAPFRQVILVFVAAAAIVLILWKMGVIVY